MLQRSLFIALFILFGNTPDAGALQISHAARGELLYSTYCVSCHIAQNNWLNKKNATNWISLQAEVRRWHKLSAIDWHDDDVASVAKYLNNFILYCDNPVPN